MGCSLYIGLFLFICGAWGSLWMCLSLQMVSVVLHLIKHWKHGPVQLNISRLPRNTIYIKFTNQRLSQKYHLPYPGLCAVLLAASLWAKKYSCWAQWEIKHMKRRMNCFVSAGSTEEGVMFGLCCSFGGLTSIQSLIHTVWHTWPEYCRQKSRLQWKLSDSHTWLQTATVSSHCCNETP